MRSQPVAAEMAYAGAELSTEPRRWWSPLAAGYRRAIAGLESYPLERIGLAAIAAGVVLRVVAMFTMDFRSDGDTYTAMGHAWARTGTFLMPYGDVTTWNPTEPGYSNHYPPAYPFYLGLVFKVFGFGLAQAKGAALAMSLLAILASYLTTRDLYGRVSAAIVGGLVALEPHLIWVTGTGFSENMVMVFFAVTMWAIVKSLTDTRYIVFAGLAAGLAYLSRSSVGYFFVIAGVGGFVWRFLYMRWAVFRNGWYMLAIVLFGSIILAWAWRNVALFGYAEETVSLRELARVGGIGAMGVAGLALVALGALTALRKRAPAWWAFGIPVGIALLGAGLYALPGAVKLPTLHVEVPRWETSSYVRYVQTLAWQKPYDWGHAMMLKIPLFIGFLAWYIVPFAPETWRATKRVREEHTSALWLSVALVWVIAWIITAMFWVFERSWIYWLDNHRYILIGLLPLAWLVVREMRMERASARIRVILLMLSLFAAGAGTFVSPVKFSDLRAAEYMDPYLRPGDTVGVDGGTIKYAFYAYLTHPEDILVVGCSKASAAQNCTSGYGADWQQRYEPEFVVALKEESYGRGYTQVFHHNQTFWNGGVMRAALWARDDVIAERGIPTGVWVHE